MKIFISGGCKNGKSYYAQHLAKNQQNIGNLYYIATMRPVDGEDSERIERHVKDRDGWGFETVEQPDDINKILDKCDINGSFLLDSLTALLANEMFPANNINHNAADKISAELKELLNAVENIVIVSDYIYSDAELYDDLTDEYRKSLAQIDKIAAANCDTVLECAYANIIFHKGGEFRNYETFKEIF
jgi:adenosylcobinamide kinase/adenosylcobinamide-phosphate guanylyltransferase